MSDKVKISMVVMVVFNIGLLILVVSLLCIKGSMEMDMLMCRARIKILQDRLPDIESDHIKWPNSLEFKRKR